MSKKNKIDIEFLKEKDLLKGVVIVDSFDDKFGPLCANKPKALLPLVNIPFIEYSLELLDSSHVEEVFLLSGFHSDILKSYIRSSRWSSSKMKVNIVILDSCMSFGDCLRELDSKALIRNDFIFMTSDSVANISLRPIVDNFKLTTEKDKGSIMMAIMKKISPGHSTRTCDEEIVVVKTAGTSKIVHYQKLIGHKKFEMPVTVLQEYNSVDVCCDLMNSQICICSPTVLSLFSDNFDFQTFDDFIKGILINEEILGNSIYLHTVENEYAARVSNLEMYSAISFDVIERWTYPLVPDLMTSASYLTHNLYKDKSVTLDRGSVIEENVVIGSDTTIGKNTRILHSVIGKNCKIGDNIQIENSFIWDNVKIENNCKVFQSLVADNVVIKSNSTVNIRSLLGYNVIIGPSVTLIKGTILTSDPPDDDFGDNSIGQESDKSLVGSEGRGYLYRSYDDDSDEDDEVDDDRKTKLMRDLWGLKIVSSDDNESCSSSEMSVENNPDEEEEEQGASPQHQDVKLFCNEVLDSLLRGIEEKINCDNLVLEINSSKYAYNVTMKEVNTNVTSVILSIPLINKDASSAQEYFRCLKPYILQLLPLFKNYIKSSDSQTDCLLAIQDFMLKHFSISSSIIKILHLFYEEDVLNEESIVSWYNKKLDDQDHRFDDLKSLRKQVSSFINWLQEAEEESDSEDED